MKKFFFLLTVFCFGASFADAQTNQLADKADNQSWNDVQLTVPISEKFDFYTALTMRFGKNVTRLNDGRYAVGVVYKPNKAITLQPFYWFIAARNSRGEFLREHRFNLRAGYRLPFKRFGLSHRSTFEYRRRAPRNSWRYRPSLTFEKEVPKNLISKAKFFVTEEVFYDSILKRFSRNRISFGVTKTLTDKLSLDVFFLRQNDGFTRPGDLNVIGTSWKIRL
jgi:hypothetical protein